MDLVLTLAIKAEARATRLKQWLRLQIAGYEHRDRQFYREALESVICQVIKIVYYPYLFLGISLLTSQVIPPFYTCVYNVSHNTFQRFFYRVWEVVEQICWLKLE